MCGSTPFYLTTKLFDLRAHSTLPKSSTKNGTGPVNLYFVGGKREPTRGYPIHVCVLRRASVPSPERACARCVLDHHRTCVASTGVMPHPAFQFYYRNVLLFFNRKTVSGPPSCARSPCRQWSPEHGRLDNVFGQHPSLHKERSAINRSLGILKALYTVIMSTNIILLPGAVRQHNDRLCLTVRCC